MILLTGGAGYIGSHTTVGLMAQGFDVLVYDNFRNSTMAAPQAVAHITGKQATIVKGDIRDSDTLRHTLQSHPIDAVIHFAGLKSVPDSVANPLSYYDNNVVGTLSMLETMTACGVKKLLFSSSASVYGTVNVAPYREDMPIGKCTNPYGQTKAAIELILEALATSDPTWRIAALRYFNAVGAHESGQIGEDPTGIPGNLSPIIAQVAVGRLPQLNITGDDFATPDGTGVRDYIHVTDLVAGHLAALRYLDAHTGYDVFNLGMGQGISVREMLEAFRHISGREIPAVVAPRRAGDVATAYADVSKAERLLGFKASLGLARMVQDTWRWQSTHPHGYQPQP